MTEEEVKIKLNKEYKNIGEISIEKMHEEDILVSNIEYVKSIMGIIQPLKIEDPIIVGKTWRDGNYELIDGYHRLKSKILEGETSIKVIVLDDYKIKRKSDSLFSFLNGLVGSTVKFISGEVILVDETYYEIKWNEGCGGCSSGWSSLKVLDNFINKKIKVKTVESKDEDDDKYKLYINGELVAEVDSGYGNGFYGGDFEINIKN